MWRNFTHCGVLYAHVPEVDPLTSPPAPRDAAGATAEPATAADPDMSAEAVRTGLVQIAKGWRDSHKLMHDPKWRPMPPLVRQ